MSHDIRVNADLFRLACSCVSTEETRYCLKGVYVEAHAEGVTLTSTDGNKLICIHDKDGYAARPAIIGVDKTTLKACKSGKGEVRFLAIDTLGEKPSGTAKATVLSGADLETLSPVAMQANVEIYGTFPDWRRVIPSPDALADKNCSDSFSGPLLADFAKLGREFKLLDDVLHNGAMRLTHGVSGGPALVRWDSTENAFGVLMPMRSNAGRTIPDFVSWRPELKATG